MLPPDLGKEPSVRSTIPIRLGRLALNNCLASVATRGPLNNKKPQRDLTGAKFSTFGRVALLKATASSLS
jgi:hypothetical protein